MSNASLVTSIQQIDANRLRVGIRFQGFGDKVCQWQQNFLNQFFLSQTRVSYQGIVKRCRYACVLDCNRRFHVRPTDDDTPPEAETDTEREKTEDGDGEGAEEADDGAEDNKNAVAGGARSEKAGADDDDDEGAPVALPLPIRARITAPHKLTPIRRVRRALPEPGVAAGRHWRLQDDAWEVRTRGMEVTAAAKARTDDANQTRSETMQEKVSKDTK